MKKSRRFFIVGLPAAIVLARPRLAFAGPKAGRSRTSPVRPTAKPTARPTAKPVKPTAVKVDRKTAKLAKTHVIRPKHIRKVKSDKGVRARRRRLNMKGRVHKIDGTPRLNVEAFGQALHAKLGSHVNGYAWQLRQNGTPMHTGIWKFARTPSDGGQGWGVDTRMHIASISKLFTAMAMAHKLRGANRKYTDRIWDYLPKYWSLGPKMKDVNFRHLLNHTAGFRVPGSDTDFSVMKAKVAQGVAPTFGEYQYENVNFALCRILIPVLHGWINKHDTHGTSTDHIWDVRSTLRFKEYCNTHIFGPSGVPEVGFKPAAGGALAYDVSGGSGWNSDDLATVSGGAGFRMSVNEVLDVMGTFRRSGKILPKADAQSFLDMFLGIDQQIDTDAGKLYNKNGAWSPPNDARLEQCVAVFMPRDMELCMFVNSRILKNGKAVSLRQTITDTYVENLV